MNHVVLYTNLQVHLVVLSNVTNIFQHVMYQDHG